MTSDRVQRLPQLEKLLDYSFDAPVTISCNNSSHRVSRLTEPNRELTRLGI